MYEAVVNALVLATDQRHARRVVEAGRWLNATDDFGRHHGKIVPLFPHLMDPQGNVADVQVVGVIPYVREAGDNLTYTATNYAVALKLAIDAPSLDHAGRYLASLRWFNAEGGLVYHGHSAPAEVGDFDEKLA